MRKFAIVLAAFAAIGIAIRECLDHMIVFGEAHLRRILGAYAAYYNEARTHWRAFRIHH